MSKEHVFEVVMHVPAEHYSTVSEVVKEYAQIISATLIVGDEIKPLPPQINRVGTHIVKAQKAQKPQQKKILRPRGGQGGRMTSRELVWQFLSSKTGPVAISEIGKYLTQYDYSATTASPSISVLKKIGKVEFVGRGWVQRIDDEVPA